MKKLLFLLVICFFACLTITKADSPLTSTDIATAYSDEKIIITAEQANGVLTDELIKYLLVKSNPICLKIAIINKLGWSIDGKNNAEIFWDYIQKNNTEPLRVVCSVMRSLYS
jgi:hypothetical protein